MRSINRYFSNHLSKPTIAHPSKTTLRVDTLFVYIPHCKLCDLQKRRNTTTTVESRHSPARRHSGHIIWPRKGIFQQLQQLGIRVQSFNRDWCNIGSRAAQGFADHDSCSPGCGPDNDRVWSNNNEQRKHPEISSKFVSPFSYLPTQSEAVLYNWNIIMYLYSMGETPQIVWLLIFLQARGGCTYVLK